MPIRGCSIPRRDIWRTTCRRFYSESGSISQYVHEKRNEPLPVFQPPTSHRSIRSKSLLDDERKTRSRHVLRSILRECSYLPDSQTRQWTAKHALSRFRDYGFKAWKKRFDPEYEERLRMKEKEARNHLTSLKRANQGERDCLLRVMLMAYGRIGKRRHQLMEPLLPVKERVSYESVAEAEGEDVGDTAITERADTTLKTAVDDSSGVDDEAALHHYTPAATSTETLYVPLTRTLDLPPALRALLVSQMKAKPPDLVRKNPTRLNPDISELNSWMRAMPQKRIKNAKRKHYAHLLSRMHPPLPLEEWEKLRRLASGERQVEEVPSKRKTAASSSSAQNAENSLSALDLVVMYGKAPKKIFELHNGHAITSRFMQRLYAAVFALCPKMEWEEERWRVTWGGRALNASGRATMRGMSSESKSEEGIGSAAEAHEVILDRNGT